jgi:hypothetical protein
MQRSVRPGDDGANRVVHHDRHQRTVGVEALVLGEDLGKWTSMHRAHPKRAPSASNTTGSVPGVYSQLISEFDRNRLS